MNKSSFSGYFTAKIKEGGTEILAPVTFSAEFGFEIADRFTFDRFANGIVPVEEMKKQLSSALSTILTREFSVPTPLKKVEDISKDIFRPLINHSVTKWDVIWGIKLTSAKLISLNIPQEFKDKLPQKNKWFGKK